MCAELSARFSRFWPLERSALFQLKLYRLGLMCIHDLHGVLLSINPAAAKSLGYTPQECLGRSVRDLLAPLVKHLFDDYLQRIQSNQHRQLRHVRAVALL
jgi:PAS domain S-box-containing protein